MRLIDALELKRSISVSSVIEDGKHIFDIIDEQSTVEPEQRWIPCTPETMPETSDEVLTTYIVNGNRKKRYVETATWYDGDEGYWSSPWDEYRVAGTRVEVIAWMPLPEPYKEDADG